MEKLLYVEVSVVCAIVIGFILFQIGRAIDNRTETMILFWDGTCMFALPLVDMAWMIIDGMPGSLTAPAVMAFGIIYQLLNCATALLSLLYICLRADHTGVVARKNVLLISIPALIFAALAVSSPWTGFTVQVDQSNTYVRGSLYLLQLLVCYLYTGSMLVVILKKMFSHKNTQARRDMVPLLVFPLAPMVGSLITASTGLPAVTPADMISLVLVYLNIKDAQITIDALTGLNNRRRLNEYLDRVVRTGSSSQLTYILMLDVDKFKSINDLFGHVEGDCALQEIAHILRGLCSGQSGTLLARFGGDEFAIVLSCKNETDVEKFMASITQACQERNAKTTRPWMLVISAGYALLPARGGEVAIKRTLAEADNMLYRNKRATGTKSIVRLEAAVGKENAPTLGTGR